MLRRMIALALAGLVVAAPPALASPRWNSQTKNASATASRVAGGCSFDQGSRPGSVLVNCTGSHQASLVYVFTTTSKAQKSPMLLVSGFGWAHVRRSMQVTSRSIRVTLTISGYAHIQLNTVTVSYYTL